MALEGFFVPTAGGRGGSFPPISTNFPGPPPEGYYPNGSMYGDPGINPNASQRPPIAPGPPGQSPDTALDQINDLFRRLTGAPLLTGPGVAKEKPGDPGATPAGGSVMGGGAKGVLQGGPGFCFGAEKEICKGTEPFDGLCKFTSNLVCLVIGLTILLALIGLGVHGILS